ncbi:MAG: hypothetical protein AAGA23_09355 [Pseudomonadota bacterium]
MSKSVFLSALACTFLLSACQTVPVDNTQGELIASEGVRQYFAENENVGEIVVNNDSDIRCVRNRRVGTHMVVRVCRTKAEWDELRRGTEQQQRRRLYAGGCGDTSTTGNRCSEGRPGGGGAGF